MNEKENPIERLDDEDDLMIDALLAEFIPEKHSDRKVPPDLSESILRRLTELNASQTRGATVQRSRSKPKLLRVVSVIVAVAACIAGLAWLGSLPLGSSGEEQVASQPEIDQPIPVAADEETGRQLTAQPGASAKTPLERKGVPKGVRLDSPRIATAPKDSALPESSRLDDADKLAKSPQQLQPIGQMANRLSDLSSQYWKTLGIEPTAEASASELTARVQHQLASPASADLLSDVERLRAHLAQPKIARAVATKWLASSVNANASVFEREENEGLAKELAKGFSGKTPFATTMVSLIDGSNTNSEAFYGLLATQSPGGGNAVGLAHQLASLTMSSDLRCVRCHDSMIGRTGTQDDHWAFVAVIRNSLQRSRVGWAIADRADSRPLFFELPDGRQRMAEPMVSSALLRSDQTPRDFSQWTSQLASSDEFAGGVVDSLWKMVHGRTLTPVAVDAHAPPSNEALDQVRQELIRDLIASDFDVSRTLALIVSSPMNRRAIPDSIRPENSLTASDRDRAVAMEKVDAFAAAVTRPSATRRDRLDLAMKRIGGSIKEGALNALLAQPVLRSTESTISAVRKANTAMEFAKQLSVDFPGNDATLPVEWLGRIKDFDQQVQHLAYLAGERDVPSDVAAISKQLRDAGSTESALSRLWWILND